LQKIILNHKRMVAKNTYATVPCTSFLIKIKLRYASLN